MFEIFRQGTLIVSFAIKVKILRYGKFGAERSYKHIRETNHTTKKKQTVTDETWKLTEVLSLPWLIMTETEK